MKLRLVRKFTEAGNIVSFRFASDETFEWQAGQYQRWQLMVDDKLTDHWFTISSAPYEKELMITTRVHEESTFKQALDALKADDTIEGSALDGDFIWQESNLPLIFIAGGIGVTPFHSILMQRAHESPTIPVTMLYANATDDIAYKASFDQLSKAHPELSISYIIGQQITKELLAERLPEISRSFVYVSGPEGMVDAVSVELKELGVEDHNLKRDWFPGYQNNE